MPDASLHTMTRIRTILYNQQQRAANYRAQQHIPRGLTLATVSANSLDNDKILEQDSYVIPDSPSRRPPKISFVGNTYLVIDTPVLQYFNNVGGPVVKYTASSLPTGLSIDETTGIISGTPSVLTSSSVYEISACNSFGCDTISIQLSVNIKAPNISYSGSPFTFTKGTFVTPKTLTNTGGTIASVSGTLPAGLILNVVNGLFLGTPTTVESGLYPITATNQTGSSTFNIDITINPEAPNFAYASGVFAGYQNTPLVPIVPSGVIGSPTFSAASLPSGLSIDVVSGAITGTPTTVAGSTSYTILGTNVTGVKAQAINIQIYNQPPIISYSPSSNVFVKDVPISTLSVTNTGGPVISYSISPSLPSGLNFNSSTGAITGTALVTAASATYTVTAFGSQTATTTLTVRVDPPAPVISYSSPQNYTVGSPITPLTPTNTGGTATSYTDVSTLPSGLSLNTSTGEISGTPSAAGSATYLISASNVTGESVASLVINITV